jgi:transcriptional regulator with XRE-family HTH domain
MSFMAANIPQTVQHRQAYIGQFVERRLHQRSIKFPVMGNNLKIIRNRLTWTLDKAAEAMGVSRSQYIKLERGERRLTSDYIAQAAEAFGVSHSEITEARVPVMGYVGAGAAAHYYAESDGHFDEVPMPPGGGKDTVALEVRGDSLGSFFNQWLVYYDDIRNPVTPDLLGRLVVCETVDGRILVKKLMRGMRPGHFHLLSQTESPIEDVELVWAARVKHMTPR